MARSLARGEIEALATLLAPEVTLVLPPRSSRSVSRSEALAELIKWRQQWRSCDITVGALVCSRTLCAATASVDGITRAGTPGHVELRLVWCAQRDRLCRLEAKPTSVEGSRP